MANIHYGRIGDVWKHLPLAEILSIEQPKDYCESHAGSAWYPLTHSWERDYGVFYFFEYASESAALSTSTYLQLLKDYAISGDLRTCPGSPLIAMRVLQRDHARFLFCDIDADSILTIQSSAAELGLSGSALSIVHGDGVSALSEAASSLSDQRAQDTFAHLDPYQPLDKSPKGISSLDLFCALTNYGVKCMFWYGYPAYQYREFLFARLKAAWAANAFASSKYCLWCGDIALVAMDDSTFAINPGVLGCGIICSNLSPESIAACERLGNGLAEIYSRTRFPDGHSGAIRYSSPQL